MEPMFPWNRFNFRWPLPHVAGSPYLRVLSVSKTSDRPSDYPHFVSLSACQTLSLKEACRISLVPKMPIDSMLLVRTPEAIRRSSPCLLYTSDAADEEDSVDLGGRRIIKKKKKKEKKN